MVPTEEERLPFRISVSVRRLSTLNIRGRTPPFPTTRFMFIRSSHIRITMVMLHAGPNPKRTLLVLYQTILLIEFPLL